MVEISMSGPLVSRDESHSDCKIKEWCLGVKDENRGPSVFRDPSTSFHDNVSPAKISK